MFVAHDPFLSKVACKFDAISVVLQQTTNQEFPAVGFL